MAKKYEELTFSDDFMFCKVLENHPDLCRKLLELALGREVGELVSVNRQKPIEILPDKKGVRFDIYSEGRGGKKIYDVEMQNHSRDILQKRTRYSQAMIDLHLLERGKPYRDLGDTYIIFICRFNVFEEEGLHRYTFSNLCHEKTSLELGDGTEKIFLCTEGTADDISSEMEAFLKYVAEGIPGDIFTEELDKAVKEARDHVRWRQEYMTLLEQLEIEREEGRKEERVNTEREKKRADEAEKRADAAEERADAAEERADALEEKYRRLLERMEQMHSEKDLT